jgi:hypothetical protein
MEIGLKLRTVHYLCTHEQHKLCPIKDQVLSGLSLSNQVLQEWECSCSCHWIKFLEDEKGRTIILDKLLDSNDVWIEKDEYVGRAGDGTIVSLGLDKLKVERYLRSYPNPTDW